MFTERLTLFPGRPVPALRSPYLDADATTGRPTRDAFERVKDVILEALDGNAVAAAGYAAEGPPAPTIVIAKGIYERLRGSLPDSLWDGEDAALERAVRERIDDETIRKVVRNVSRALRLGSVRVRSIDLQEKELTAGRPVSAFWTLEGDHASLRDVEGPTGPEAVLAYDFSAPGKQEVAPLRHPRSPVRVRTTVPDPDRAHPRRRVARHRFLCRVRGPSLPDETPAVHRDLPVQGGDHPGIRPRGRAGREQDQALDPVPGSGLRPGVRGAPRQGPPDPGASREPPGSGPGGPSARATTPRR